MKQVFNYLIVLLLFQSCRKDNIQNPDRVNARIRINANVYSIGGGYSSSITRATLPLLGTEYIAISGAVSSTSQLRILLPPHPQAGTYNIGASFPYVASYYDGTNQISYGSIDGSGTITIQQVTGIFIKGTFEFNCYSSASQVAEITLGSFEGDL